MTFCETCLDSRSYLVVQHMELGAVERGADAITYFALCGGGAPSNKYFENGRFDTTETDYCRSMKKVVSEVVLAGLEARVRSATNV
jgi:uncharacterized protein